MNKILLISLMIIAPFLANGQAKYDSISALLLDRMSTVIGELSSCTYEMTTAIDELDADGELITHYGVHKVFMTGPDKMAVNSRNEKGHREFRYDGLDFVYYSHDENNFVKIPAPPTILLTIDSLHDMYEFDFPAADMFYPSFTDDLIQNFNEIRYLGRAMIDGKPCFQIVARNLAMDVQLWISDDVYNLPYKLQIIDKTTEDRLRYEGSFISWEVNPDLPVSLFNFTPPPGAKEITILSVKDVEN